MLVVCLMQNILVMSWIDNLKQIMSDQNPKVNIEILKDRIEANGHSLSRNSISNILNGNNNPKIETLQVIAEALNVDISDLFNYHEAGNSGLTGFVEYKGTIHRIQSVQDLERLLEEVKGKLTKE